MKGVVIDGTLYRVRIVYNTLERSFSLRSGVNEGYMLSGRHERDLLGTSRDYALLVLEYFDRQGMTRREGDLRRPGPVPLGGEP